MESRKMVLMNLLAGQQWRHGHREQTNGHGAGGGGRERMGQMERVTWKHIRLLFSHQVVSNSL